MQDLGSAIPDFIPVLLLYPGKNALNLSRGGLFPADLGGRRLTVFLLDATWSLGRKMLRLSSSLQRLPRDYVHPSKPKPVPDQTTSLTTTACREP